VQFSKPCSVRQEVKLSGVRACHPFSQLVEPPARNFGNEIVAAAKMP
jgi:hypothetical protein